MLLKLNPTEEQHHALLDTMHAFNAACNYVAGQVPPPEGRGLAVGWLLPVSAGPGLDQSQPGVETPIGLR